MGADAGSLVRESVEFHRLVLEKELELSQERVRTFEKAHKMTSEEFERKFKSGALGDERQWFDWLAEIEVARQLGAKVESLRKLP
jgi:hypothetical protein